MDRIDGHSGSVAVQGYLSIRPLQRSKRRYVPTAVKRIDRNEITHRNILMDADKYFSMDRIDLEPVQIRNFDVRTLDDPHRGLVSAGSAAIKRDCLRMPLRHHNLVFDRIVIKLMDGTRHQSVLAE